LIRRVRYASEVLVISSSWRSIFSSFVIVVVRVRVRVRDLNGVTCTTTRVD